MTLASYIDHTLLKATATRADIEQLCQEARQYGFYAVCLNPLYLPQAVQSLKGSGVKLATVCAFPLGALSSAQKAAEAAQSVEMGADEVDMVISLADALEDRWTEVERDIRAVRQATGGRVLKVIVETCFLSDEQKRQTTEVAVRAGADFVKTSTGFGSAGATVADVQLMRAVIGDRPVAIKAAGGIRTLTDAQAMIAAGATRLGTSGGVALMQGQGLSGY